jgi:hypothetical protein
MQHALVAEMPQVAVQGGGKLNAREQKYNDQSDNKPGFHITPPQPNTLLLAISPIN